ncbi:MAG TPA: hypothetical protein VJI12_02330 [archaeon]|nr:hypothetical protein [archaeon]
MFRYGDIKILPMNIIPLCVENGVLYCMRRDDIEITKGDKGFYRCIDNELHSIDPSMLPQAARLSAAKHYGYYFDASGSVSDR